MAERYLVGHMEEKTGDLDVMSPRLAARRRAARRQRRATWVEYEAPNGKLRVKVARGGVRLVADPRRRRRRVPELPPGAAMELPGRGTTFVRTLAGPARRADRCCCCTAGRRPPTSTGSPATSRSAEHFRVVALDHRGHGRGIRTPQAVPPRGLRRRRRRRVRRARHRAVHPRRLLDGRPDRPAALAPPPPSASPGLVLCATSAYFVRRRARSGSASSASPGSPPSPGSRRLQARRWLTEQLYLQRKARPVGAVGGRGGRPRTTGGRCSRPGGRSATSRRRDVDRRGRRADVGRHHDARPRRAGAPPGAPVRGDPRRRGVPRRRRPRRRSSPTPSSFVPTLLRACQSRRRAGRRGHADAARRRLPIAARRRRRGAPRQPASRRDRCVRRAARDATAQRNLDLARLGVQVGAHVRDHRGAQAVRLRRAARRARPRARAADRRGDRRAARQHEGRVDEARPDGQLRRRGPAGTAARGAGAAAVERAADERRARRRGDRARARRAARASCSSSGTRSRSPRPASARCTAPSSSIPPPASSARSR